MQSFVKICRSAAGGGFRPTRRTRINPTVDGALALPVSRLMVPVRTPLVPAIGNPVIAAPLAHPVSGDPDVRMIAPLPETRRPNVTDARRRYHLDANRRRSDVDVDADGDTGRCNGGHGN